MSIKNGDISKAYLEKLSKDTLYQIIEDEFYTRRTRTYAAIIFLHKSGLSGVV